MKSASLLCLAAVALIGCTTTTETTQTTTRTSSRATADSRTGATPIDENRSISKRTYTHDDIQKTGRSGDLGDALQTLDPSIYASGR